MTTHGLLQEMSKKISAFLFDLDGTLVDTEKFYQQCWPKAFNHFGYEMTNDQFLSIRSLGKPFIIPTLKKYSGDENFNYEKVIEYRNILMIDLMEKEGLQLKKGAREILEFLCEKKIICSVVTASPVSRANDYLEKLGILKYFYKIISARDVKEGKPSPDCYQFACNQLSLSPSECVAVEDSPNGVCSAWKAGCNVIMVPDLAPPDEETRSRLFALEDDLYGIKNLFIDEKIF